MRPRKLCLTGRQLVTTFAVSTAAFAAVVQTRGSTLQEPPGEVLMIRAGALFDGASKSLWEGGEILVSGERINDVGTDLVTPRDARSIDLTGLTVLPGLIDAHTHLLNGQRPGEDMMAKHVRQSEEGTAWRALRGAARAAEFLHAGITTVRDLGNAGAYGDVSLRDALREGLFEGPRMLVSGPGLVPDDASWYQSLLWNAPAAREEYKYVGNVADARRAVRENIERGVDVIKIYVLTPTSFSVEVISAIVEEAHDHGVPVAAHANGDAAVSLAAEGGVDSVEHGYNATESSLKMLAERGIFLVPTDLSDDMSDTIGRLWDSQAGLSPHELATFVSGERERLRHAMVEGVRIVAGSDNYMEIDTPLGEAAKHVLFAYEDAGMAPADVLLAATRTAATLLGREDEIGVLKAGAFADIIAVEGNPLDDLHALQRVRFVMQSGRVIVGPGRVP